MSHSRKTRREFLRDAALVGAGLWIGSGRAPAQVKSRGQKLRIAVIGVSGRGAANLHKVSHEQIVALCDVDERRTGEARKRFPKARFYVDFRKMLEKEAKNIDAVVVSTPDHTHAVATMAALKLGKHVYCEKPLTHTVAECRIVEKTAAEKGVATQMGTQIHAGSNYRRVVEALQTGAIGKISEVHVWVARQWVGGDRPKETPPVPKGLHWDLWLGPAPYRPYHPAYVPASWRGWWDFGGGTLADMGCHYIDLVHWALKLRYPRTVAAEGPPVHPESAPPWLIVHYEYPARGDLPPVKMTWYQGGKRPHYFAEGKMPEWGDGVLFVGEKGMMIADYNRYVLLPEKEFADYKPPAPFIPDSIGHHKEWIEACKNGGKTTCDFSYSGPLAESVLLGNVAYRSGKKIVWDGEKGTIANAPEARKFLSQPYRKGWTL